MMGLFCNSVIIYNEKMLEESDYYSKIIGSVIQRTNKLKKNDSDSFAFGHHLAFMFHMS